MRWPNKVASILTNTDVRIRKAVRELQHLTESDEMHHVLSQEDLNELTLIRDVPAYCKIPCLGHFSPCTVFMQYAEGSGKAFEVCASLTLSEPSAKPGHHDVRRKGKPK